MLKSVHREASSIVRLKGGGSRWKLVCSTLKLAEAVWKPSNKFRFSLKLSEIHSDLNELYTISRFSKSYICFLGLKRLWSSKSIYAKAFLEIVYIKSPVFSLQIKNAYIRFPKNLICIYETQLFRSNRSKSKSSPYLCVNSL